MIARLNLFVIFWLAAGLHGQCVMAEGLRAIAPSCVQPLSVMPFQTFAQARQKVKITQDTFKNTVGAERLTELDSALARLIDFNDTVHSADGRQLARLLIEVQSSFTANFMAEAPLTLKQLRQNLERAVALNRDEVAAKLKPIIGEMEACVDRLRPDTCASIWQKAKKALALDPPPAAGPASLSTLKQADNIAYVVARSLDRYAAADELLAMDVEIARLKAGNIKMDSPEAASLTALIHQVEQRFFEAFRRQIEQVLKELRAHLATASGAKDRHMLSHLLYCRDHLSTEDCAAVWYRVQRSAWTTLWPLTPEEIKIRDLSAGIAGRVAQPTNGDFAFASSLSALGSDERRTEFKTALDAQYSNEKAIIREQFRKSWSSPEKPYADVSNLDRALTLFTEPPTVVMLPSKVGLRGRVRVGEKSILVDVTFDSRSRYFTVQDQSSATVGFRYLQLIAHPDGHLTILDADSVSQIESGRRLILTHFAY